MVNCFFLFLDFGFQWILMIKGNHAGLNGNIHSEVTGWCSGISGSLEQIDLPALNPANYVASSRASVSLFPHALF